MSESEERIECRVPTPGKKSTRIHKRKYDLIAKAILAVLPSSGEGVRFKDLANLVSAKLDKAAKEKIGSIGWYTTTVKLDLECREKISRIPGVKPQRLIKTGK